MDEDRLRDLFERATDLAPEEQTQFVALACGDDVDLKAELLGLLVADAATADDGFWQRSALHNEIVADLGDGAGVGDIIGTYRLVELIGRGGMGAVYRATRVDAEFEQCVAIKLIEAVLYSPDVIAQFRAERQILANLNHPNIARLLDGGTLRDGLPYLIMEYVDGISPYEYCLKHNLTTTQRLMLFRQLCSGVHSAHQNMVIHRDLKPANILVTSDGTPKLLDFGIAKVLNPDASHWTEAATRPGMLKLTARYASPEQVRGEAVTTASDVYSLGVILYELLAGHSPYGDAERPTHQIMHAVCEEEPTRPSAWAGNLKGDLDKIILRALRKSPLERYPSADQFSEDILRYIEGRPVQARGETSMYVAAKFIRRNRVAVAVAALLVCSLVGGLIALTLARERSERRFNQVRQLAHSVMFDYADAIDQLPGATPVRARLVKDALTYLDNLSREADTPQLQREIVDAYVRVSNVQGNEYENNLGDTAAAMLSARKAADAAEKLLREDKTLPALASAASAFSSYGSMLYATGDLTSAMTAYQRALALYNEIATAAPQDLDNKIALSTCLRHLGDLNGGYGFRNLGRTPEALADYNQAKSLMVDLNKQFPANLYLTKESYKILLSLVSVEAAAGLNDEAAKDLEQALAEIRAVSAAEPRDSNDKVELAVAESRLGQMKLDDRNAAAAVLHFAVSAGLLQQLLAADPGNAMFRRGQVVVEAQWAAALRNTGRTTDALAHNQQALQLAQALNKGDPGSVQYLADVGNSERKLSEGLLAAGQPMAALHDAQQAERIFCQSRPAPADPDGLANCDRSLLAIGNAERALRDPLAAIQSLRKAVDIASAQSNADPVNALLRSDSARAQASLAGAYAEAGDRENARATYERALAAWSILRRTKSISAEDSHRSDASGQALAALQSRH